MNDIPPALLTVNSEPLIRVLAFGKLDGQPQIPRALDIVHLE